MPIDIQGSTIIKKVKRVIIDSLELQIATDELDGDELLFGGELGENSMAMMKVIVGIEKAFGIKISDEELIVDVFETVNSIAAFIKSKVS